MISISEPRDMCFNVKFWSCCKFDMKIIEERDDPFSMYARFLEKLTFCPLWYAHVADQELRNDSFSVNFV